ncbi:glycosyltransferase [Candidatus Roizmanbacteria bacterium]|nr:glycosyltransferase [Candidatus Roizmanbacteria bacterium]
MKLLFITPRFPFPPFRGDQSVPFHRMRVLSRRHEITLLSIYEQDEDLKGIEPLKQFCRSIHIFKLPKWKSFKNLALIGPVSKLPLQVLYYQSDGFKKSLNNLIANNRFDLVHAFMLRIAPFCRDLSVPIVLDLIDSMQLNFRRRVDMARAPHKWLLQEELRRLHIFEEDMCFHFNRVLVVSKKDKECISSENVNVVPLGVDTEQFAPRIFSVDNPTIIFSGNMFYGPNIHAVKWFVENCYFRILEKIPNISFIIAGNKPPPDIKILENNPGITVTGFVESMPDMIKGASVAIAPMQSGSGMQFKILEAMSCGLPVITNALGLGDIKAKDKIEILLAESANDFVQQIIECLTRNKYALNIGTCAREFVLNHHSWEHTTGEVEKIYSQILAQRLTN